MQDNSLLVHDERNELNKDTQTLNYIKQIEQINKQLNEFVYIVSHDLKAPLRGIKSLATFLEEEIGTEAKPEVKDMLILLQSRADKMQSMIDAILHYSRMSNNNGEEREVDLNKLIADIINLIAIPEHIRIEVSESLPIVYAEKIKIQEVFQNLITNAIKYNNKQLGFIKIGYEERSDEFEFSISDNGIGIKEEFFQKIFGIFQTLQGSDKGEATGIGLTIVQKIIEQNGGRIWVESEIGSGSTFKFVWKKYNSTFSNKIVPNL
jgi:light-regulated signal transduction histidine kinase (bacteriophytochrome)